MRLEKFRVTHYRSVKDSGWIAVGDQTSLVGRNESGKSNLLLALRSLKPPEHLERLSVSRDFPADQLRLDYSEEMDVVQTVWMLTPEESEHLATIFPRARGVTRVEVGRGFEPLRWVRFTNLREHEAPIAHAKDLCSRLGSPTRERDHDTDPSYRRALQNLEAEVARTAADPRAWAENVRSAIGELRGPVNSADVNDGAREALNELSDLTDQAANDTEAEHAARDWVLQQLPSFLYLDDYAEIQGQQDLGAFLERRREGRPHESDAYFEKLLVVAGLEGDAVEHLLHADHEERRQIANRAGAVLTRKLRELWNERSLKVRFNLDGQHFNTLISDPNSIYDVEVNLNERSRGFRWFFSFYVTFAADAKLGSTENMIMLLDEPGLYLHALGQRDLLNHFKSDFPNQVIYSTHSPFMIPANGIASVRTVSIDEESGTTVSPTPSGDAKTLFPIRHALGMEISQGLFDEGRHLIVGEITDYWYLRATSDFIRSRSGRGLPKDLHITPAGGCSRLPYLVALLSGERSSCLVLMNDDPAAGRPEITESIARLLPQQNLIRVCEALDEASGGEEGEGAPVARGVDVEDLIDPQLYDRFVRYCWRNDLKDKKLQPDRCIPGVIERYTQALAAVGLEFNRVRPARLFLRGMGKNPTSVLPKTTRDRFERLFTAIHQRLDSFED